MRHKHLVPRGPEEKVSVLELEHVLGPVAQRAVVDPATGNADVSPFVPETVRARERGERRVRSFDYGRGTPCLTVTTLSQSFPGQPDPIGLGWGQLLLSGKASGCNLTFMCPTHQVSKRRLSSEII